MLDFVRKHSRSWGIKVLLWLVIIVFVGWGGYLYQTRHESDIAKVGDHYISAVEYQTAFGNLQEAMRNQFGGAVPEDLMRSVNLKEQALQSLIQHYLIMRGARELGLMATTEEVQRRILAIPVFQAAGGRFDSKRYEGMLLQMRMTPDMFERQMSEDITTQKVQSFIKGRALVTEDEILADYHLDHDRVRISYIEFVPGSFEDKVTVEDAAIQAYYQNNQNRYMEPERREIAYVLLSREDLEKEIRPTEDEIKRYYEDNAARYTQEKQVRARHILFKTKSDASEAEVEKARAQAQKVFDEAKKGADFGDLAKKYSQDEATAKKGGDLGFFPSKQMDPAFSKAVFDMKPGEISDPVRTPHGFHIIKLEEIKEAKTAPIEEVKGEIENEIKSQDAQDLAFKRARNLRDLAYARKDIAKAAQEMKMNASEPVWITTSENQPDPGPFPDAVKAKLFQLGQDDVSEMFELPKGFAVAQVKSIKRSQPIPFENTKQKVTADLRGDLAKGLAQKKAAEILAQAREKNSLAEVAKTQNLSLRQSGLFSRQDPDKDLTLLRDAGLNSVFGLNDSKRFPDSPLELGDRFMVCQFLEKNTAGDPSPEQRGEISSRILRQKQTSVWKAWLAEEGKAIRVERLKEI
jgi:peptidyl-prolyl cis-trans isomerase D